MRSIAIRLTFAFLCVVFFLIVQGIFAVYNAKIVSQAQREAMEKELALKTLEENLAQARLTVYKLLGTMNPDEMDSYLEEFEQRKFIADRLFDQTTLDKNLLEKSWQTYNRIIQLHYDFSVKTARELINSESKEEYESLNTLLSNHLSQLAKETSNHVDDAHRLSIFITLGLCAAALLTSFVWAFILKNTLTDRRRADHELRLSEERFRQLANATWEAIVIHENGIVLQANEQYCDMFGYKPEEVHGNQMLDRTISPQSMDYIKQQIKDGFLGPYEVTGIKKDGTEFEIEIRVRMMDYHGRTARVAAIRDITDRKRSEQALRENEAKYRTLFDALSDGIVLSKDGVIIECNDQVCQLIQYSREELLNKSPLDFSPPLQPDGQSSIEKSIGKIQKAIREGPQVFSWVHIRKDGTLMDCEITLKTFELMGETIFQGTIRDVTQKKKMEEELAKAQKLESVGLLAGGIAHDFNNLLTSILGNISLAKICLDNPRECEERLNESERASLRAKDLTQQLLTFSKGGAPIKETASIKELVQETASFVLRGSNVRCHFNFPDDLNYVSIDKGQISQVIQNLILNADQAMPEGGNVYLNAENHEITSQPNRSLSTLPEGLYVKLSVQDEGSGIPEDFLPKIFDPYFSTKQKGSGLGLATSYSIMKRHGGSIQVESQWGRGACFTLYLPASTKEPDIEETSFDKVVPGSGTGRILLMDDEQLVRDTAEGMLKHLGYEVVFALDGQQAIQLYTEAMQKDQRFDLVIMDLTIPGGMGGKEAIGTLLEIDPHARALVSSGYSNDPVMANYRAYGFAGIVAKPYLLDELAEAIGRILTNA